MRKTLRVMAIVGAFVLIGAIAVAAFAANGAWVTNANKDASAPVAVTSSSHELTLEPSPSERPKAGLTRDDATAHDQADDSMNSNADPIDDSPDVTETPDGEDDHGQVADDHGDDEQGPDHLSDDSHESDDDSPDGHDQSEDSSNGGEQDVQSQHLEPETADASLEAIVDNSAVAHRQGVFLSLRRRSDRFGKRQTQLRGKMR